MVERACGFRKPFSSSVREGYSSGLSPLFLSLIHMQGIKLSTSLIKRFISLIYNDLYTTYRFCFPPSGRFRGPEPLPVPRRSISFTSDQKMRNRSPAHAESQKIVNFERIFPETTLRKPPARFRNGHEDARHGFFNYGKSDYHEEVTRKTAAFIFSVLGE